MINNKDKYIHLSSVYSKFVYEDYKYDIDGSKITLIFDYKMLGDEESIDFTHKVSYELKQNIDENRVKRFENVIFSIGLVETINYYKTTCASKFEVKCGNLNELQKKWWKKLFVQGLGEFIYLNGLEEVFESRDMFEMQVNEKLEKFSLQNGNLDGFLVPIGGGKDSVVTLEGLKDYKKDILPFVMSAPKAAYDCIEVGGYDSYLKSTRIFDNKLFELNEKGFLNGHVPFSAILAFISVFGAVLTGKKYIALSNEKSANEPTVHGKTFNHQYSKSYEFERDFFDYSTTYLVDDVYYFSFLRPLYEIEIGRKFATYSQYLEVFRSCNRGKKQNIWCSECSKCLFVYIILYPYVDKEKLVKIFRKDMLDDKSMANIFEELIGITDKKPFECVGTVSEIKHSLKLALDKEDGDLPYLLKTYKKYFENEPDMENVKEKHNVPKHLLSLVEE